MRAGESLECGKAGQPVQEGSGQCRGKGVSRGEGTRQGEEPLGGMDQGEEVLTRT